MKKYYNQQSMNRHNSKPTSSRYYDQYSVHSVNSPRQFATNQNVISYQPGYAQQSKHYSQRCAQKEYGNVNYQRDRTQSRQKVNKLRDRSQDVVYHSKYTTITELPQLQQMSQSRQTGIYSSSKNKPHVSVQAAHLSQSRVALQQQLQNVKKETIYNPKRQTYDEFQKQETYFGLFAAKNSYEKVKNSRNQEGQSRNSKLQVPRQTGYNGNSRNPSKISGEKAQNIKKQYARLRQYLEELQKQNEKMREQNTQLKQKKVSIQSKQTPQLIKNITLGPSPSPNRNQNSIYQNLAIQHSPKDEKHQYKQQKVNKQTKNPGNSNDIFEVNKNLNNTNENQKIFNLFKESREISIYDYGNFGASSKVQAFTNQVKSMQKQRDIDLRLSQKDIVRSLTELSQAERSNTNMETYDLLKKARDQIISRDKIIKDLSYRLSEISQAVTGSNKLEKALITPACQNCVSSTTLRQQLQQSTSECRLLFRKVQLFQTEMKQIGNKLQYFMSAYERQRDLIIQKQLQIDMHMKYTRKLMTELGYWNAQAQARFSKVWYQCEQTIDQDVNQDMYQNTGTLPSIENENQFSLMPKLANFTLGQIPAPAQRPVSRTQPYQATYISSASTSAAVPLSSSNAIPLSGSWLYGSKI